MKALPSHWASYLIARPEAAMGVQTGNVVLRDSRRFVDVVIDSGFITGIRGRPRGDIPFEGEDVTEIEITNNRWNWRE